MSSRFFARAALAAAAAVLLLRPSDAFAIPSFSAQTNQPCSACHVGAFGPQLKPYGRDFKLYGYVASDRPDNDNLYERLTLTTVGGYTRTKADQPGLVADGFRSNNNIIADEVSVFYGGRITKTVGAMAEWVYDTTAKIWTTDAFDVRHAYDGEFKGKDYVFGVEASNQLGDTDTWNTMPAWGFPYDASALAPGPTASTFLDDTLDARIMGPGAYLAWDDWLYVEGSAFIPTSRRFNEALGPRPTPTDDQFEGVIPYGRISVQHETKNHEQYFQAGAFGTEVSLFPGGDQTTGAKDRWTDYGADASYQWMHDLHNMFSAHAVWIHENRDLDASFALGGSTNTSDHIDEFRTDASYTINDTWIPSAQYFRTTGSNDPLLWGTANGSPDTEGFTAELAWVPWGKPDSPMSTWAGARVGLQYTAYTKFDGTTANASDNNTLFLSLHLAIAPLVPVFSKDESSHFWSGK